MNCHATKAVLDLFTEGRLTPRRASAVEAHLASCADCRGAMQPLAPATAPASSDFKSRLAVTLKAQQRKKSETGLTPQAELTLWPRDFSAVALAAVALCLIAAMIGWSGMPSQFDLSGDEFIAGRTP